MKREFLQEFQVGGEPLPKEVVDAIMAENGRDIQKAKAAFEDYPQLKEELERLRQQDPEGARETAKQWEEKYNQAVQQHAQQLSQLEFEHCMRTAIRDAQGRNERAIMALLDVEDLKKSEDPKTAIFQALENLRKENDYLFLQDPLPPAYAWGTGTRSMAAERAPATLAGALLEKYERK